MAKSDAAATCHTEAVRTWAGEEEKKFQVITFFIYIFCWHLNSLWWPTCPNDRRMNHSFCASIQAFIHAIVQALPLRETDVLSVCTWSSRPRRAYCRSQTRKQFVCEKSPSKQKQQSKSVANEFIRSDLHLPVNGIHSNAFTRLPSISTQWENDRHFLLEIVSGFPGKRSSTKLFTLYHRGCRNSWLSRVHWK